MTDHPITPPPELQEEWLGLWPQDALLQAARWGADQELEACRDWLVEYEWDRLATQLRAARRPKSLSLLEEALEALNEMNAPLGVVTASRCDTIRRALKRLQELEGQGDG